MNKYLVALIVLIAVGAGGYFLIGHPKSVTAPVTTTTVEQTAWIEVTSDFVYLDVSDDQKALLKSGDTLHVGDVIDTGTKGKAVIHFPDGSLARVDSGTKLTLSTLSFNTGDNSLVVSIGLTIGRVWSKVVGLATPQSSWEVKTSNTVATVRGTAFGVVYKSGTSWVLGSQHTVAVAPLDPKNKKKIAAAEVTLDENKVIKITNSDAAVASTAVSSSTMASKITPMTKEFSTDAWVRADQEADKQFDTRMDELRATSESDASMREKIRSKDAELKDTLIRTLKPEPTPETQPNVKPVSDLKTPPIPVPVPVVQTSGVTSAPVAVAVAAPTAENTVIQASRTLSDLTEDDTVQFKAVEGTRDITSSVEWQVTGSDIGSITPSGVFTALLGDAVAEFGEGTGSVTATLPNGDVIQGPSLHVQAKLPTDLGTQG